MNKYVSGLVFFLLTSVIFYACETDQKTSTQIERDKIIAVEDQLRDNTWKFNDLLVSVKLEANAIPLLANVADENGMVQPGIYNSYAIFGNNDRQLNSSYQFTRDDILRDTSGSGDFMKIAGYFVLNTSEIRINPDSSNKINFSYSNNADENTFIINASSFYSPDLIASVNNRIVKSILADRPDDLAEKIVDFLQNNENISKAIERFLYEIIHSKVEEITQSPEEISEKLAAAIVEKLGEIDWEEVLYNRILEFLQNLQAEDPEEKAGELAQRLAEKIEASLAQSDIYDVILPILQDFEDNTLPVLASRIAAAAYDRISEVLSEENIYKRVYPVWEQLTQADSANVSETADTLASVVTAYFFDADTLTEKLLPFLGKVDETSPFKLGELSQEIIDSVLIPMVEVINGAFPGLGLEPDWASVKPIITSLLTAIKAGLGSQPIEEFAESFADGIIGIMEGVIQKGFEKAIFSLQEIPADQAASVIAAWLTNLLEMAEEPVVGFIEGKLNALFDKFEAEKAAETISELMYNKILEIFSEEGLNDLLLPLLEEFQEADVEQIADLIAAWILELDLKPEDLTKEELIAQLSKVISQLIGNMDPENATQALLDLLLENDLIKQLDGRILQTVLKFKIYELYGRVSGSVNAIDGVEIVLSVK